MRKTTLLAGFCLALVSSGSFSQAQCHNGCHPSLAQTFRAGYDANVHWPRIYIPPARRSVCQTYNAMVNNGWRRQNLLGDYHFNKDTNELTDAGKLKVNWILSQAPVERRSVFVQRGAAELQTTARIAAVHDYAGKMSPSVGQVDVNDTHIVAEGHPASSVDSVFVGYEANRLPPVLPASTGGGDGGSTQ
ncbi:MAG: hypothetical protein AAGD11_05815 [Planctomycetota bacterium]